MSNECEQTTTDEVYPPTHKSFGCIIKLGDAMNNEWITDRLPTEEDADCHGYVWVTDKDGKVWHTMWDSFYGLAWMHFTRPEPYVRPKGWMAQYDESFGCWAVSSLTHVTHLSQLEENNDKHREAAERIAAIYEEVMP